MQSIQTTLPPEYNYLNCPFQTVEDFLHHCHLDQYLDIFLSEGFDSITSLLEITEEDMTVMSVKRGHRRLIQREIATIKGISRDQPLITNMMNAKYHDMMPANLKMEDQRRNQSYGNPNMNNLTSYDVIGLTSPRSMNSGIGSSTSGSGTSSSSGPMSTLRSGNPKTSNAPNNLIIPYHYHHHRKSGSPPTTTSTSNNNNNMSALIDVRSSATSSNDDNDSIDTNESVPSKRKYRRHAKPDRNAPVKPPSAYIMFSNDARAELKNQNLSFADMAKVVGEQWKNLSHAKKQHYERMAMRAKDEYLAALEQYRQTDQHKKYKEYLEDFKQKQEANNRMIGRARKRPKQPSPGSGSIADSSSNGNSNGNGSSGSGSADGYGDKKSVIRRQQEQQRSSDEAPRNSDSGYTSQSYFQPNFSSEAMMRGILPIEFVQNITPEPPRKQSSSEELEEEDEVTSDGSSTFKRRSPRFEKTKQ